MKRDFITEILDKRSRNQDGAKNYISSRLCIIELAFKRIDLDELSKYIPIATIASIEGYFRCIFKELIDFGSPFIDNAEEFKEMRFDFKIVKAIQGKSITVGDFIAHLLPLSSMNDIVNNMTTIIGDKFSYKLDKCQELWNVREDGTKFVEDFSELYNGVSRLFELRHIYCHELSTNPFEEVDRELIKQCFEKAKIFIQATEAFIDNLLYPNVPKSQAEMNMLAYEDLAEREQALNEIIDKVILCLSDKQKEEFRVSQDKWMDYKAKYSEFYANLCVEGGTMWPTIKATIQRSLTQERIDELERVIKIGDLKK